MDYKLYDLHNPYTAFIVVATVITISIAILRFIFKRCVLLWKSTLMSYIMSVICTTFWYIGVSWMIGKEGTLADLFSIIYGILLLLLAIPGMFIYGLIPGVIKPCPSDTDLFGWFTFGFLFYILVFWGRNKFRKYREEMKAAVKKQINEAEKQTPMETDTKGV
jgi:hypothetical protein